jgi:hypothetical protein
MIQESEEEIKAKQKAMDEEAIRDKRDLTRKKAQREKFEEIQSQRKNIDLIHCIILLPALIFQFLEDFMIELDTGTIPILSEALRAYCTTTIIPLLWLVWKHYTYRLAEMKLRKEAYHKTTLLKSSLLRPLLIEWFLNCLHIPPLTKWTFSMTILDTKVQYSTDTFIAICSLPKLYILLRVFQNYTRWTNYRAIRICQINGFTPDTIFAIKCINKSNATAFLLFIFSFSVVFFGFAVQNFER